jgi:hypothetical protein
MELGFIASLKVALMGVLITRLVAPFRGTVNRTVGAGVIVVNVHT